MATKALTPKKPTTAEFLKMISGPKVDIYVGKNKKHYSLPKDLLSYHSTYFDRCFNGKFKEAKEQRLDLVDDEVVDFEIMLEYMLHGSLPNFSVVRGNRLVFDKCMSIIAYADKYEMAAVCEMLHGPLRKALLLQLDEESEDEQPGKTGAEAH